MSYYQNEDGGFGHAVEADGRDLSSIPLHSNTASDIIRRINFEDANHPVIQRGAEMGEENMRKKRGRIWLNQQTRK